MIPFTKTLHTNGSGYWSTQAKAVKVTDISVPYIDDVRDFGELRVHFDTRSWDVDEDGLIYTDKQFLAELLATLKDEGFDVSDVGYSEQGMQGADYVSLDVGPNFIASWVYA